MSSYWTWEGPKNWWEPKEGVWTFMDPAKYFHWVGGVAALLFGWMLINTQYTTFAVVYLIMTIFFIFTVWLETMAPAVRYAAVIVPQVSSPMALYNILLGVIVGTAFALLYPISGIAFPLLAITPVVVANFGLSVFAIPFTEEYIFGGLLCPTLAEDTGIVLSVILTSLAFGAFHWGVAAMTGATLEVVLMLTIFRAIASTLILWRHDLLIGMSMHITVNAIAFWAMMIIPGGV